MIGLQKSCLVRSEFLELGLEELTLISSNLLLVEDQNLGNVVVMDLKENQHQSARLS